MRTAIAWTLQRSFPIHFLLIEHVLVLVTEDSSGRWALAWKYDSATEARADAVAETEAHENANYRLIGTVRSAAVLVDLDDLAESYMNPTPVGPMLQRMLDRAGHGEALT